MRRLWIWMRKQTTLLAFTACVIVIYLNKQPTAVPSIPPTLAAPDIVGNAKVADGDSLTINGKRIRLFGIDAPELAQRCLDNNRKSYTCGKSARSALAMLVAGGDISCRERDIDKYERIVASCIKHNVDIAEQMVKQGWALAYRHYSEGYVPAEEEAQKNGNGIWQGKFENPQEWRKAH